MEGKCFGSLQLLGANSRIPLGHRISRNDDTVPANCDIDHFEPQLLASFRKIWWSAVLCFFEINRNPILLNLFNAPTKFNTNFHRFVSFSSIERGKMSPQQMFCFSAASLRFSIFIHFPNYVDGEINRNYFGNALISFK